MSEIYYSPENIVCAHDGIVRTVHVKRYRFNGSMACDTFFSVPAHTRIKGRYAHGYVTSEDGVLEFRIHTASKERLGL